MIALRIAAIFVFYVGFCVLIAGAVVFGQGCVDYARKRLRERRGVKRLTRLSDRLAEDREVADLDAIWVLPTREPTR